MALGCMQALRDLHFRCPEAVSLAGIDDMPWSTALSPPLTVVSQPIEALAKVACEQLLQRIAGLTHAETPPRRTLFPPSLVVRDSCAARTDS
jgi:LacI family transcriptional regulator